MTKAILMVHDIKKLLQEPFLQPLNYMPIAVLFALGQTISVEDCMQMSCWRLWSDRKCQYCLNTWNMQVTEHLVCSQLSNYSRNIISSQLSIESWTVNKELISTISNGRWFAFASCTFCQISTEHWRLHEYNWKVTASR